MPTALVRPFALLWTVLIGLVLAPAAWGQDVTVQAEVDRRSLRPDEVVNYAVIVAGEGTALVPTPNVPPTVGLAAVDPYPTTQAEVSIINGEARQSVVFRWAFRPVRSGKASIGQTVVRVGKRTFRTSPIDVNVSPGLSAPPTQGRMPTPAPPATAPDRTTSRDVFVRAVPSQQTAWQGEQVVVDYLLYFDPELLIQDLRQIGSWDTDGFWREELDLAADRHPALVNEGGRAYAKLVIKRVALFATRSGTLTVSPFEVGGEAAVPAGVAAGGMLRLHNRMLPVSATAPALTLTVRPLPGGAPASFGGAVGAFALNVSPGPTNLQTGETTTLTATVSGDGNLATLAAPTFAPPPALDVYPTRSDLSISRTGVRVQGRKTFEYPIVPLEPGTHATPPLVFTYFDPESGQYRTLSDGGATLVATGPPVVRQGRTASPGTLLPPRTDATFEAPDATPLHRKVWPYVVLVAPLIGLGLISSRRRLPIHRPAARRRDEAVDALADARRQVDGADVPAFYDALAHALERAAEATLGGSVRGLTRLSLDAALRAHGVDDATVGRLADVLLRADLARFAGIAPDAAQRRADLAAADALLPRLAPPVLPSAAVVVALLLLWAPAAYAQPGPDSAKARFETAVQAGNLAALRDLAQATDDPAVLHALGTVAAQQQQAALAVWSLERAQRLDPSDTSAAHNLAVVRATTRLDTLAAPRGDLAPTLWTDIVRRIGAVPLFWLGALLWWGGAALVALRIRRKLTLAWTQRGLALLFPAALVVLGAAFAASAEVGVLRDAVVTQAAVVRAQPSDESDDVSALPPGALVALLPDEMAAWRQVRTGDGRTGYLPTAALAPLDQRLPPR